ncbi:MAG: site-2 protease family protein [Proteobacteria bacterium]|nr:site-2 protease family protein [Pseudomonadota bacterium]MBU2469966.1 site-2 protease family protein [Pseudomonadota bacterium]MBU2519074.1 site-2 protease family protein [Pseudomonadota bacterium]
MGWLTDFLLKLVMLAPPILMALTVHEASHALVAWLRGDPTAKQRGRMSLNPIRHLDMAGTLVFFVTAWFGSGFGWAKPVPIDGRRLRNPRWDMVWISAAGPLSNILFAIIIAAALYLLVQAGVFAGYAQWKWYFGQMMIVGVTVNVILAFFNLIPLPPLDGSGILTGLLPPKAAWRYQQLNRYGFVILLALIFLPRWLPGMPNVVSYLVLLPAQSVLNLLLPY